MLYIACVLPCLGLFLVQYVAYSVFALPYMSYLVFVLQCLGLTFCALPCMSYLIWAFSLCSMWLTVSVPYLVCVLQSCLVSVLQSSLGLSSQKVSYSVLSAVFHCYEIVYSSMNYMT